MTADVKTFLKNLLYVGAGTILSALFSTVFTILGARKLGPEEYGAFVLIQSVAQFLYIPMLLGFSTAMLKYTSEKSDSDRQSNIISTTYILVTLFTIASAIVIFLFRQQLSSLFSISTDHFSISLIFAIILVFYVLSTDTLRGLDKTKVYAVFQVVYASILLLVFLFFILNNSFSFISMIYPILFAYGTVAIIVPFFFFRKSFRLRFDKLWANILVKYALFAVIGGLSSTFYGNINKIFISKYMNIADVGIYSAYYSASVNVIGLFWGLFNIIYFPAISKYENKELIFKRINKLTPYLILIGIPLIMVCEFVILKLFGNQYPIHVLLMLLFAISSVLMVLFGLYDWTFAAQGIKGINLGILGSMTIAILTVLLSYLLIPHFGLFGAAGTVVMSFSAGIFCLVLLKRRLR